MICSKVLISEYLSEFLDGREFLHQQLIVRRHCRRHFRRHFRRHCLLMKDKQFLCVPTSMIPVPVQALTELSIHHGGLFDIHFTMYLLP